MSKEKEKLITLAKAAEVAGVSPTALRRAARLGDLKAELYGKIWLTTEQAVKRWKETHFNPNMRREFERKKKKSE